MVMLRIPVHVDIILICIIISLCYFIMAHLITIQVKSHINQT